MPAHKKAKLFMQYAEKAQVSETPWEYFDGRKVGQNEWKTLTGTPFFFDTHDYRLKPTIIKVTGADGTVHEFPEPLRELPAEGAEVYYPSNDVEKGCRKTYFSMAYNYHQVLFRNGQLHNNSEAAIAHSKAQVSLTARGDV